MASTLGEAFVRSLAAKDAVALAGVFAHHVDFQGLTPGRHWQVTDPAGVVDVVFGHWFEPQDDVREVLWTDHDTIGGRERVGYRLAVTNPDGDFLVEQHAYYVDTGGVVDWMRVLCSGYQPVGAAVGSDAEPVVPA